MPYLDAGRTGAPVVMQAAVDELAYRRLDVHEAESALEILAEDLSECLNGCPTVGLEVSLVPRSVMDEGDDPLLGLGQRPTCCGQLVERWDLHLDESSGGMVSEDTARSVARGIRELVQELPLSQILLEWEISKSELHTLVQWRSLGDGESGRMEHRTRALSGVSVSVACVSKDVATKAMEKDTVLVVELMKSPPSLSMSIRPSKEHILKGILRPVKQDQAQGLPRALPTPVRPSPLRNSLSSSSSSGREAEIEESACENIKVGGCQQASPHRSTPIGIPGARSEPAIPQRIGSSLGVLISPPAIGLRTRSTGAVAKSFGDSPRPMRRSAGEKPIMPGSSPSELIGSFAGSFQESLLTGHMSGIPCNEFEGFTADISASNSDSRTPHKKISFSAILYHANKNGEPMPYVASIPLEKPFRIPAHGLLQVTLFNPSKTPIKMFLVKFNVSDMPVCSKTFIRQTISTAGVLSKVKYAVQLQLMCPKKKRYYLRKEIRVVFPLRKPDESLDKLVLEHKLPESPRYFRLEDSPLFK